MPFSLDSSALEEVNGFANYVNTLLEDGTIREDLLDSPALFEVLKSEYSKRFEDKSRGRIIKEQLDIVSDYGVSSVNDALAFKQESEDLRAKREQNRSIAERINFVLSGANRALGLGADIALSQSDRVGFSVDQAQRLGGEGISTIGDALTANYGIGGFVSRLGQNIVRQQDRDIALSGYQPTYKGSFLEQNFLDMPGWVLEKTVENSVTGGLSLLGAGATALTAPVSAPLSAGIAGTTFAGSSLLAIGDVASELKEKEVYDADNAPLTVAVGLLSGALDVAGAGAVIPKGAVINKLFRDGVVHEVAEDVTRSGVLEAATKGAAIEGLTEVMQEGITVAYAASQGADYEADELVNRFADAAILGGVMGGVAGASVNAIESAANEITDEGREPNVTDIAIRVRENEAQGEAVGSQFSETINGLSPSQAQNFAASVAQSESGGRQDVINQYGYSGLYQFGAAALADVGLIRRDRFDAAGRGVKTGNAGHLDFLQNPDNWTIEGGLDTFLASREIQDKAFADLTNLNIQRGRRSGAITDDGDAGHIAGYAKAAHLVGAGNANRFVLEDKDKSDANGTSASRYYESGRAAINAPQTVRTVISDADGRQRSVTYDVVEASQLPDAETTIEQIDYPLVNGSAATFEQGAPVLSGGEVVAGSNRAAGIKQAYAQDQAGDYRQALIDDAESLGFNRDTVENFDQPVLIRRLDEAATTQRDQPATTENQADADSGQVAPVNEQRGLGGIDSGDNLVVSGSGDTTTVDRGDGSISALSGVGINSAGGGSGSNNPPPGGDDAGFASGDNQGGQDRTLLDESLERRVAEVETPNTQERIQSAFKNIKDWLVRKTASPTFLFGTDAVAYAEQLNSVYDSIRHETSVAVDELQKAEKLRYSGFGVTQKVADDRYRYLTSGNPEEKAAIELFPEEKVVLDGMRQKIDELSQEFMDVIITDIAIDYGVDVNSDQFTSDAFLESFENYVRVHNVKAEDYKRLKTAIDAARNIKNNIGSYLTRTYASSTHPDAWNRLVLNSDAPHFKNIRQNAAPFFIAEARKQLPNESNDAIINRSKELMRIFVESLSDNRQVGTSEGVLLERSQLLENKPELRALLGEHTDIESAYTNAIHRMRKTLAMKQFYQNINQVMRERGTVFVPEEESTSDLRRINVTRGRIVKNPFYGLYTDPATAEFIERATDDRNITPLVESMMMLNGIWSMSHTVGSAPTAVANVLSTIPVLLSTLSNGKSIANTFRAINYTFKLDAETPSETINNALGLDGDSQDASGYQGTFQRTYGFSPKEMYDFALKNQLTSGGALGGETEKYIQEGGLDALGRRFGAWLNENGVPEPLTGGLGNAASKTLSFAQGFYNVGDSIPKLSIFFNETERLNNLNQKYGDNVIKREDILSAAANLAKQQAPQYARIPEVVDAIRRFPFLGQFVAFVSQMYQTQYNQARINMAMMRPEENAVFLKEHMKINVDAFDQPAATRFNENNPPRLEGTRAERLKEQMVSELNERGRQKAAAQLATLAFYTTAMGAVISAAYGIFGESNDLGEEELEAIGQLMPDYYRFIDKQYVGRDEEGRPKFINTSRLDMYGGITDSLKIPAAYANGEFSGTASDAALTFIDSIFSPFYEPTFLSRTIAAGVTNRDSYDRAIIVSEDGLIENAGNVVSYLLKELFENGSTRGIQEIYKDLFAEGELNKRTGNEYDLANAQKTFLGTGEITFDAKRQALFWMYRLKGEERELRSRLNGRLKSLNTINEDEMKSLMAGARDYHHKLYNNMRLKISAAQSLGISMEELKDAAKIAGVSESDFDNYLSQDKNPPFMMKRIGEKSIDGVNFRQLSENAKRNFAANYDNARQVLNSLPAY